MFNRKTFAALFVPCAVAALVATASAQSKLYPVKGGVSVRACAYADHSVALKYASRYDMSISKTPDGTTWDFTLDNRPNYHYTGGISGAFYPTTYNNKPTATLRATLHQYEIYEERVTFKNLGLGMEEGTAPDKYPFMFGPKSPAQFLRLNEPQTVVTPSGISVTLPVQGAQTAREFFSGGFSGNLGALFMKIDVSPDQREVTLPDSPLYKNMANPSLSNWKRHLQI